MGQHSQPFPNLSNHQIPSNFFSGPKGHKVQSVNQAFISGFNNKRKVKYLALSAGHITEVYLPSRIADV